MDPSAPVPVLEGLALDAVEWLPSGSDAGLVRVRGRWTDLNRRELAVLIPMVGAMIWMGLYPEPLLRRTEAAARRYVEMVSPHVPPAAIQMEARR